MRIIENEQGTIEWKTARLWRLTASNMSAVITSTGGLSASKAAENHIDKLIAGIELANVLNSQPEKFAGMAEWELAKFMSNYNGDKFSGNSHTERGNKCEADAIAAMSELLGQDISSAGMIVMGDSENGVVSCSPDGVIYDGGALVAGVEVKSPCLFNYHRHVLDDVFPDEYRLQVHASMAICDVDRWHFGSYFDGKPLFYKEVRRDAFTDKIAYSLVLFRALYENRFHQLAEAMRLLERGAK